MRGFLFVCYSVVSLLFASRKSSLRTSKNTQVFTSYKKQDQQTPLITRTIAKTLEESYGYQVFLDIDWVTTAGEWAISMRPFIATMY
jgi:hypothetical protein